MAANVQAFREIALRPRMAMKVPRPDLATTVLGTPLRLPVLLAPCGLTRLMHPEGAAGAARAAGAAGTVSILSTVAGTAPEDLSGIAGPRWFQLYAADRDTAVALIDRAGAAGFGGLMVTVDTPALGKRERDLRNGVAPPLRLDARSAIRLGSQVLSRPRWTASMGLAGVKFKRRSATNPPGSGPSPSFPNPLSPAGKVAMGASPFSWDDVSWLRSRWTGPLVVKGVMSGDDAALAADAGADCVVVSNHGGRQLEGAPATIRVLPEVVEAAGKRVAVLVDGGVRRGADVVKAMALGACAVLIGRPYLYGLAIAGQAGVERILAILEEEMERTLILMGCPGLGELDGSWLQPT